MSRVSRSPSPDPQILKIVLFILAGIILILGLVVGFGLLSGANGMASNFLMPLQLMGGGAISNLIAPMLSSFFFNLGLVALIFALSLSDLLYALARLLARMAGLEARLARLETGD